MPDLETTSSSSFASNAASFLFANPGPNLVTSLSYRADREAGRSRHGGYAAPTNHVSLGPGPQPTRTLAHRDLQQAPLPTNDSLRVHPNRRSYRRDPVDPFDRLVRSGALDVDGDEYLSVRADMTVPGALR